MRINVRYGMFDNLRQEWTNALTEIIYFQVIKVLVLIKWLHKSQASTAICPTKWDCKTNRI